MVFCVGLLSIASGILGLIYYFKNSKKYIFTYYVSNILTFICGIIILAMSCAFLSKWFDQNTYNVAHYENQNHRSRYYIFAIHWLVIIVSLLGTTIAAMASVSKNVNTNITSPNTSQDFEMNSIQC